MYKARGVTSIIVNNTIYAFGGYTDKWQYMYIGPPTCSPSQAPLEAPTPFGPTPSPIFTSMTVYIRTNGSDYGYCNSSSIDFAR